TEPGLIAHSAGAVSGSQAPLPDTAMTWPMTTSPAVVAMPARIPRPSVAAHAAGTAIIADSIVRAIRRSKSVNTSDDGADNPTSTPAMPTVATRMTATAMVHSR